MAPACGLPTRADARLALRNLGSPDPVTGTGGSAGVSEPFGDGPPGPPSLLTGHPPHQACRDFLELAETHSRKWQRALQYEQEQRIHLEETIEQLARQHNSLERAFRSAPGRAASPSKSFSEGEPAPGHPPCSLGVPSASWLGFRGPPGHAPLLPTPGARPCPCTPMTGTGSKDEPRGWASWVPGGCPPNLGLGGHRCPGKGKLGHWPAFWEMGEASRRREAPWAGG